ncbi:response regulator transcription factor [Kaarinaea lacus]
MDETLSTIFVIDDDASVRKGLQRLLRSHRYQVETFASAEEYLKSDRYEGLGVIILDLSLPGLDGIDLQTRLLEAGSQLPIIFLTGYGDIETSVVAIKRGAENFLTKPVDEEKLLIGLEEALSHHREILKKGLNTQAIKQHLESLTPREYEILRYVISGALNKQIAQQLDIVEKTVKVHRGRVLEKMQAKSVAELVRLCDAAGVQPLSVLDSHRQTVAQP